MKILNAIMSIICLFTSIGALYTFLTCSENATKWFLLVLICLLFSITFYAFYMAEYWKQRYEEAVGLRPKTK